MGTCIHEKDFCIVTEYVELGSLKDVLMKNKDLTFEVIINMASDAARGFHFIVIHGSNFGFE